VHDIFVSYAHSDNDPPGDKGPEYGWVSFFIQELQKKLRQKLGGPGADIWWDIHIVANDIVQDTLNARLQNSRALVIFLSPGYMKSDWCRDELIQFLENHAPEKNKERVFIVEVDEIPRATWHERLQQLTPIPLWEKAPSGNHTRRIGDPLPDTTKPGLYWDRLNELACLIKDSLSLTQATAPPPMLAPMAPVGPADTAAYALPGHVTVESRPVVWVAEPVGDMHEHWLSLASAIRQAGAEVCPLGPSFYPRDSEERYRAAIEMEMKNASLLVQLLGRETGPTLGSGTGSICQIQNQLAHSELQDHAAATGTARRQFLQWRPPNLIPENVADLSHATLLHGAISCGFEEFRKKVVDAIAESTAFQTEGLEIPGSTISGPSGGMTPAPLAICVSADQADQELAQVVGKLLGQLGTDVLHAPRPTKSQKPADFHREFDELIGNTEGFIIVYGNAPTTWVQAQYMRARKVLMQRRSGIWGALIDGPPPEKDPAGVSSPSLMTLQCRNGPDLAQLDRFVSTLRGAPNA
jgi:hypothetical protein